MVLGENYESKAGGCVVRPVDRSIVHLELVSILGPSTTTSFHFAYPLCGRGNPIQTKGARRCAHALVVTAKAAGKMILTKMAIPAARFGLLSARNAVD